MCQYSTMLPQLNIIFVPRLDTACATMDGTAKPSLVPREPSKEHSNTERHEPKMVDSEKVNELDNSSAVTSLVTINMSGI